MNISERIFAFIKEREMTQKEFADAASISQSTISDWKRKKLNPSSDKILKICEVLQVTPYEILGESREYRTESHKDDGLCDAFVLNEDEQYLLEKYRVLKNDSKKRILGYLDAIMEQSGK